MGTPNDINFISLMKIFDAPGERKEESQPPPSPITPMDQEELEEWKRDAEDAARHNAVLVAENTMNEVFDNRAHLHPHGITNYDYSSISKERREGLEKLKMRIRHENYGYLQEQPELDALIQLLLKKVLQAQPADPIRFAAEFFAKKNKQVFSNNRTEEIEDQKKKIEHYRLTHPKVKMPTVNSLLLKRPGDLYPLQSLGIQPHAHDFKFEREKRAQESTAQPPRKPQKNTSEPEPSKHNCGCRDPGRKVIFQHGNPKGGFLNRIDLLGEEEQEEGRKRSIFQPSNTPVSTADEYESTAEGSVNYEADDDEDEFEEE